MALGVLSYSDGWFLLHRDMQSESRVISVFTFKMNFNVILYSILFGATGSISIIVNISDGGGGVGRKYMIAIASHV
jgi:hypothetical protein